MTNYERALISGATMLTRFQESESLLPLSLTIKKKKMFFFIKRKIEDKKKELAIFTYPLPFYR